VRDCNDDELVSATRSTGTATGCTGGFLTSLQCSGWYSHRSGGDDGGDRRWRTTRVLGGGVTDAQVDRVLGENEGAGGGDTSYRPRSDCLGVRAKRWRGAGYCATRARVWHGATRGGGDRCPQPVGDRGRGSRDADQRRAVAGPT
jgi:hypothetical protein